MLEIPIDAELERTLAAVAARTGDAPGELARKALLAYLEDIEDYATAVDSAREFDHADTVSIEALMARYEVKG